MTITVSETIAAPRERVWEIVTDYTHWAERISGIIDVEILEPPKEGIVGLKWKETREFFGKEATEIMWVTAAEPTHWYEVRAESHGAIYTTRVSLASLADGTTLTFQFSAQPTTLGARVMSLLSFMFNGSIRKAFQSDLGDIRAAAEARA